MSWESGESMISDAVQKAAAVVGGRKSLTVLVNDPQRHTDTATVLARLAGHFDPTKTRILVATGTHSFPSAAREQYQLQVQGGRQYADFAWHDCRSDKLVPIGHDASWLGHPWLLGDGGLLAIGSVEPHYFAGFTGAHKTCTIGVAAYEEIEANHSAAMGPLCQPCKLAGNPIYEGVAAMLSGLEALRPVAAVNLVQSGRRVLAAFGGRPVESLQEAACVARQAFTRTIPRQSDALVLDVAGALGVSFYQADKGIKNNEWAVRSGGVIVLQAPCPDGIGQDHFVSLLLEAPGYDQARAVVAARGYRLGDHKAVRLRYLTDDQYRGVRVYIVSDGLSPEHAGVLGFTKATSAEHAMAHAGLRADDCNICTIPDAGNMVVTVQPAV